MLEVDLHTSIIFQIAKAEKLKPMEVELKKLEDLSESIVNDFAYMRAREEEMRDTNGLLDNESSSCKYHTVHIQLFK